jgi:hypothetical protein
MVLHIERWGCQQYMKQINTKRTELKILINERDNKKGRCGDSNPLDTPNGFYLFTQQLITFNARTVT